ncbi:MAG: RNA methyltransferase [Actinobacteria bacterium]|nr:RNA methyltransferase [Actinomycetota bacterium]MBI3687320.1 RNA methyltransferase [Actinomycetota bacterium]
MPRITSTHNPRVRAALDLTKARERDRRGAFGVEGVREIARALAAGLVPTEAFWLPPERRSPDADRVVDELAGRPAVTGHEVSPAVFDRLVVRSGSDGVYVVFARPSAPSLDDLGLPPTPLLVAVEGVEKPGNLGALLRVCDGAGVHAAVVLDDAVDPFNPNVIRASLGTVFAVPVVTVTSDRFRSWCHRHGVAVHAAALADRAVSYCDVDYTGPTVLLLGSEARGLSRAWLEHADTLVRIPMRGVADSLNVATAGAVLVYEAVRQRGGAG